MIIYSAGVIGFEVDLIVLQVFFRTNLPLFTKVVFARFDRSSHRKSVLFYRSIQIPLDSRVIQL